MELGKTFKTDAKKELEGVEKPIGDGGFVTVARTGNKRYRDMFKKLAKPYRRQIMRDSLPDDVADEIMNETMSQTILLGWRGLTENGEEVPYSRDKAKEWLAKYPDFKDLITDLAGELASFKDDEDEEDLGKSSTPSATS